MLKRILHVLIQFLAIIIITLVIITVVEIVFRIAFGTPPKFVNVAVVNNAIPDPIINHKWKPNSDYVEKRVTPITMHFNRQSWSEKKDTTIKKPENTIRIFYVGDSNTHSPVKDEDKMATIVENELKKNFKDKKNIEVINTGTSSYSPSIYYLEIKNTILKYSPDIVIINVDMTDVRDDFGYKKLTTFDKNNLPLKIRPYDPKIQASYTNQNYKNSLIQKKLTNIHEFAIMNLSSYYHIEKFVLNSKQKIKKGANLEPALIIDGTEKDANWLSNDWNSDIQKNVDYSMYLLGASIKLLRENNVKVIITGVPHYPQFDGQWNDKPHDELKKTAKEYGSYYLDSYGLIKNTGDNKLIRKYYWDEDVTHFNELGNKVWADIQIKFILDPKNKLFE